MCFCLFVLMLAVGLLSSVLANHCQYYVSDFVVSPCVVAYFLFSEWEEIFFNSIFLGLERWKLFCKLWSVLGLVRLANVLTPVRWLVLITTFLPRFVLTNFHVHDSPAFSCPTHSKILLNGSETSNAPFRE